MEDTDSRDTPAEGGTGAAARSITDWSDLGREMWSYLTGRRATVNYEFEDMLIEVPRDIGPNAPRATWRIHGIIRVTTSDNTVSDPS
ncbi:hypothetical protein [Agrococcus sp. Ld7]|uniref:hypothetical protein n=1 Tax=Agrococcus sp. Ld7 TaxID=649148 RepID=UPI00386F0732